MLRQFILLALRSSVVYRLCQPIDAPAVASVNVTPWADTLVQT
jgi:hypothetical protein